MPSTVVTGFSYDSETSTLSVTYVSGGTYVYKNVPERLYKEMKAYRSKGSFLKHYIKGKFEFEKT